MVRRGIGFLLPGACSFSQSLDASENSSREWVIRWLPGPAKKAPPKKAVPKKAAPKNAAPKKAATAVRGKEAVASPKKATETGGFWWMFLRESGGGVRLCFQ